jgi:putative transcription factor
MMDLHSPSAPRFRLEQFGRPKKVRTPQLRRPSTQTTAPTRQARESAHICSDTNNAFETSHLNWPLQTHASEMPQSFNPGTGQDWAPANAGRSGTAVKKAVPKSAHQVSMLKAAGVLSTEKRYGAGGNKSAHSGGVLSARKLEEADDVGTIVKVDKSLSKAIMQARTAKKLTQKELATAINEKPQVVAEYESGKAIPNPQIISKLERKLGVKLPRPGKSNAPKAAGGASGTTATKAPSVTRGGPPKRR